MTAADRPTRQPFALIWVLRIAIVGMLIGQADPIWRSGSCSLFSTLFVDWGVAESTALLIVRGGVSVALVCALAGLFDRSWWSQLVVAGWLLIGLATDYHQAEVLPELKPLSQSSRYVAPLVVAWLVARRDRSPVPLALVALRLAAAATFVGHGVRALFHDGMFLDYLLIADATVFHTGLDQAAAESTLTLIGVVDLAVAALVLASSWRIVPAWMAFWALTAAFARVVHSGWGNWFEVASRLPNVAVPCGVFLVLQATKRRRPSPTATATPRAALLVAAVFAFATATSATSAQDAPANDPSPRHVRVIWTEAPATTAQIVWSTRGAPDVDEADTPDYVSIRRRPQGDDDENVEFVRLDADASAPYTGSENLSYHHTAIEQLDADTVYEFTVHNGDVPSRTFWFRTAPTKRAPFAILSGGDSRSDPVVRRRVNQRIATLTAERDDLLAFAHGGDYIQSGLELDQWIRWLDDHELTIPDNGRLLPIVPTRGNHEAAGPLYDEVFAHPGGGIGKNWFASRLSPDVLLVTLNTETAAGGDQKEFLETTLTENRDVPWRVVQYHRPLWPAVKRPARAKPHWQPVFDEHELPLVLESDGHVMKRTVPIRDGKQHPDGTVYIGEGGLGVRQRTPNTDRWYLQEPGIALAAHHVWIVAFSTDAIALTAIGEDGKVLDSATIERKR